MEFPSQPSDTGLVLSGLTMPPKETIIRSLATVDATPAGQLPQSFAEPAAPQEAGSSRAPGGEQSESLLPPVPKMLQPPPGFESVVVIPKSLKSQLAAADPEDSNGQNSTSSSSQPSIKTTPTQQVSRDKSVSKKSAAEEGRSRSKEAANETPSNKTQLGDKEVSKEQIPHKQNTTKHTNQTETIGEHISKDKEPKDMNVEVEQGEITEKPTTKKTRKFGKGPASQNPNPQEPSKDNSPKEPSPSNHHSGGEQQGKPKPTPSINSESSQPSQGTIAVAQHKAKNLRNLALQASDEHAKTADMLAQCKETSINIHKELKEAEATLEAITAGTVDASMKPQACILYEALHKKLIEANIAIKTARHAENAAALTAQQALLESNTAEAKVLSLLTTKRQHTLAAVNPSNQLGGEQPQEHAQPTKSHISVNSHDRQDPAMIASQEADTLAQAAITAAHTHAKAVQEVARLNNIWEKLVKNC
jgi:hypothetical protein